MNVTQEMVEQFKDRMHISHSAEDDNLRQMLSFSISAIKHNVGEFDEDNNRAKELVFERTRYAYNDALEYFEDNFLSDLTGLGISLAIDKEDANEEV